MKKKEREKHLTELGKAICKKREERGFTQTEFANSIGKDQPSLNRLEKGRVNPGYLYLVEICEGLEISISELLLNSK